MKETNHIKTIGTDIEGFLESWKELSLEEKKLEAGLLVEEIKTIDVETAFRRVNNRIKHRSAKIRPIFLLTRVAAIFSLPLLAFTIWSLFLRETPSKLAVNEITWQEIENPIGMRSHVVLPDGTDLWLNAGSKIKYGIPFVRESRQIDLTGEAFLKVAKNAKAPFFVNTEKAFIKVFGTEFNVKAYPEDEQIEVALAEGSVEFTEILSDGREATTAMKPNDFLSLNKSNEEVQLINTKLEKHISWYRNIIILDETPMPEVAKILERWYGVKVVVADPKINKYRFTTTFENESLFRVIELLELCSPSISIKYTSAKINQYSNIATPSIVTLTLK